VVEPDQEPARATLGGYWSDRLSEYDVQRLLGFETRMEVREGDRMLAITHARDIQRARPLMTADCGELDLFQNIEFL
jgi:hypothetical protein